MGLPDAALGKLASDKEIGSLKEHRTYIPATFAQTVNTAANCHSYFAFYVHCDSLIIAFRIHQLLIHSSTGINEAISISNTADSDPSSLL